MPPESSLKRFEEVIRRLRDPQSGCPWDLKQTHSTLRRYLLEEVWEYLEAMDRESDTDMEDELGDLLLQIYLHAQLLKERTAGGIDIETIAGRICDKMVRRHPHVFGDSTGIESASDVEAAWETIKSEEKGGAQATVQSPFKKHRHLPSLLRLDKVLKDLKKRGFRFDSPVQAVDKVEEECGEVRQAAANTTHLREELGDLILSAVSAAAEYGFSSEELLHAAEAKLRNRWQSYESALSAQNLDLNGMSYEQKEALWESVKHDC